MDPVRLFNFYTQLHRFSNPKRKKHDKLRCHASFDVFYIAFIDISALG